MSQSDSFTKRSDEANKRGNSGAGPGWLVWILIAGLVPLVFVVGKNKKELPQVSRARLMELLDEERIVRGVIHYNPQSSALCEITGSYVDMNATGLTEEKRFRVTTRLNHSLETRLLDSGKFETAEPNTMVVSLLYTLAPILLVALFIYFFFIRQIKRAGRTAMGDISGDAFSTLDRVLIESARQIARPPEPLLVRMHFADNQKIEGEILWVDPQFIKYRSATERLEFIVPKSNILRFERLT
jgi:hypothetical protein